MTLTTRRGRVAGTRRLHPPCLPVRRRSRRKKCSRAVTVIAAVAAASAVWAWRVNSVWQIPYKTLVSGEVAVRADRWFRRAGRSRVAEVADRVRVCRRGGQRGPGCHDPAAQLRRQRSPHLAAAGRRIWGRPLAPVGSIPCRPCREPTALRRPVPDRGFVDRLVRRLLEPAGRRRGGELLLGQVLVVLRPIPPTSTSRGGPHRNLRAPVAADPGCSAGRVRGRALHRRVHPRRLGVHDPGGRDHADVPALQVVAARAQRPAPLR
jgi:hypothetical protein